VAEQLRQRGGREPRRLRGLSREDIVAIAIAVADEEGTAAVSMRRIARDLHVGAMSLYWYVESKDELHRLMLEGVHGEIEAAEPSGDWRGDLAGYARNYRAALHRHPWAIDFLGVGPPSGPNDARNADRLLGALDGLGLDETTTMWALLAVGTYVMGAALREIQEIRWHRAADEARAEMTEEEVAAARQGFERMIRGSGRYPHIAKIFDADVDPDAPETRDARFEFGLGCVLDGVAARIGQLSLRFGKRAWRLPAAEQQPGRGEQDGQRDRELSQEKLDRDPPRTADGEHRQGARQGLKRHCDAEGERGTGIGDEPADHDDRHQHQRVKQQDRLIADGEDVPVRQQAPCHWRERERTGEQEPGARRSHRTAGQGGEGCHENQGPGERHRRPDGVGYSQVAVYGERKCGDGQGRHHYPAAQPRGQRHGEAERTAGVGEPPPPGEREKAGQERLCGG
jgi:AcrR family transcriptional regulator